MYIGGGIKIFKNYLKGDKNFAYNIYRSNRSLLLRKMKRIIVKIKDLIL